MVPSSSDVEASMIVDDVAARDGNTDGMSEANEAITGGAPDDKPDEPSLLGDGQPENTMLKQSEKLTPHEPLSSGADAASSKKPAKPKTTPGKAENRASRTGKPAARDDSAGEVELEQLAEEIAECLRQGDKNFRSIGNILYCSFYNGDEAQFLYRGRKDRGLRKIARIVADQHAQPISVTKLYNIVACYVQEDHLNIDRDDKKKLTFSAQVELLRIESDEQKSELARRAVKEKLSVRALRKEVDGLLGVEKPARQGAVANAIKTAEKLRDRLRELEAKHGFDGMDDQRRQIAAALHDSLLTVGDNAPTSQPVVTKSGVPTSEQLIGANSGGGEEAVTNTPDGKQTTPPRKPIPKTRAARKVKKSAAPTAPEAPEAKSDGEPAGLPPKAMEADPKAPIPETGAGEQPAPVEPIKPPAPGEAGQPGPPEGKKETEGGAPTPEKAGGAAPVRVAPASSPREPVQPVDAAERQYFEQFSEDMSKVLWSRPEGLTAAEMVQRLGAERKFDVSEADVAEAFQYDKQQTRKFFEMEGDRIKLVRTDS